MYYVTTNVNNVTVKVSFTILFLLVFVKHKFHRVECASYSGVHSTWTNTVIHH